MVQDTHRPTTWIQSKARNNYPTTCVKRIKPTLKIKKPISSSFTTQKQSDQQSSRTLYLSLPFITSYKGTD